MVRQVVDILGCIITHPLNKPSLFLVFIYVIIKSQEFGKLQLVHQCECSSFAGGKVRWEMWFVYLPWESCNISTFSCAWYGWLLVRLEKCDIRRPCYNICAYSFNWQNFSRFGNDGSLLGNSKEIWSSADDMLSDRPLVLVWRLSSQVLISGLWVLHLALCHLGQWSYSNQYQLEGI